MIYRPEGKHRLDRDRVERMLLQGFRRFLDPYYQGFAAQIAFFILLSIFPTVILLSQLLGVFEVSLKFINNWIGRYVQGQMAQQIIDILDTGSTVGNNILLFLTALWSSSRAQFALMRIANYTYSGGRWSGSFWKERFRSLKTMLLLILTFAFVAIVLVYGKLIMLMIFGKVIEQSVLVTLWEILRWPLALVLYFLVVIYEYYVIPAVRVPARKLLPGALAAAVGMAVVTLFYAWYTSYIADYGLLYGSMSSIVAMMFWFYLLSWVLVLGIMFNKVWWETSDEKEA